VAAAAVMRASHRVARVTAAPAAALMSLPREICDTFALLANYSGVGCLCPPVLYKISLSLIGAIGRFCWPPCTRTRTITTATDA